MPIYEYVCQSCRSEFNLLRPMNQADAPVECERCGSRRTKRKLSLFAAQSGGKSVAGTGGGSCAGCAGGSCGTCGQG
jgi:putative FmdB family regulatory protein